MLVKIITERDPKILEDAINIWIKENIHITIKDIKYQIVLNNMGSLIYSALILAE